LQVKCSIESIIVELYSIVTLVLLLFIPTGGPQSTLHACVYSIIIGSVSACIHYFVYNREYVCIIMFMLHLQVHVILIHA
jgi:hypothetical protein